MAGTVTVACKLPHGLILRLFRMETRNEPVMGGGTREVQVATQVGEPVVIKGYAAPFGQVPSVPIEGGYALTPNVDADFWAAWVKQNEDHDAVRNRLIFANEKSESAQRKAKDQTKVRSGLEPIDPQRLPKGIEPGNRSVA
jgi:hypothetical protein